ncbi:MAG: 3-phosphoshikimate 1-carboxyvinyltransferase [Pseudomonadota bacterium]
MDVVRIIPAPSPLCGTLTLPGSKSITNRALLLAALAPGSKPVRLSGMLESDDTRHMVKALRAWGVQITQGSSNDEVKLVSPPTFQPPPAPIDVGNAGTAMRFLTAAAALVPGVITLTGDRYMRRRPIGALAEALAQWGIKTRTEDGCPPITIDGSGTLASASITVQADLSSQFVSALLMVAPRAEGPVDILVPADIPAQGYVDLTVQMMAAFGVAPVRTESGYRVQGRYHAPESYAIEPDASTATYFWAAQALTKGHITLSGKGATMGDLQPDAASRALIERFPDFPERIDGAQMQDAVPTLAVMAAFVPRPVRFVGISNLRVKECDRIAVLRRELQRVQPDLAHEEGDALVIKGDPHLAPHAPETMIDPEGDHRMAMALALLGLRCEGITITEPDCVSKTFPGYWQALAQVGARLQRG